MLLRWSDRASRPPSAGDQSLRTAGRTRCGHGRRARGRGRPSASQCARSESIGMHSPVRLQLGHYDAHHQPLEQRRPQDVSVEPSGVKRAPARGARQPHLAGTEQHRVDLIEVVVVPFEDVVERRAVVRRRRTPAGARPAGASSSSSALDRVAGLAAVQNAVVRAADRAQVVLRHRRKRRGADRADARASRRSRACPSCAARSRSTRATICTPPARLAVGATANVMPSAEHAGLRRHPRGHLVGRADVRPSSTSTPRDASSAYPSFANSSRSTRAFARSGPDPIAKNPSGLIAQPAYCDAMHDAAG